MITFKKSIKITTNFLLILYLSLTGCTLSKALVPTTDSSPTPDSTTGTVTSYTAWIGDASSKIFFSEDLKGIRLSSSSDLQCKRKKFKKCSDFNEWKLTGNTSIDSTLSLGNDATFRVSFDDNLYDEFQIQTDFNRLSKVGNVFNFKKALWTISQNETNTHMEVWASNDGKYWRYVSDIPNMPARNSPRVLKFNGKLWILGDNYNSKTGEIWNSVDAINWKPSSNKPPFSSRIAYAAAVYKNHIWLIGGAVNPKNKLGGNKPQIHSDIWKSKDGLHWQLVDEDAEFGKRFGHKLIVFKDWLLLIGGEGTLRYPYINEANGAVWASKDGENWIQKKVIPNFNYQELDHLTAFKGKLWITGGNCDGSKNIIWSSDNGWTWQQEKSTAPINSERRPDVVEFKGRLWLFESRKSPFFNSIWSSPDGLNWKKESNDYNPIGKPIRGIASNNDKLYLLADYDGPAYHKSIPSPEGKEWKLSVSNRQKYSNQKDLIYHNGKVFILGSEEATFSQARTPLSQSPNQNFHKSNPKDAKPPYRTGFGLASFKNKIWLIGGTYGGFKNDIWSSYDGERWLQEKGNPPTKAYFQLITFKDKLWLIGGQSEELKYSNDIWSSSDGLNWKLETQNAEFSPRFGHAVVEFEGKLWLIGGKENNGTYLNDIWTSENGVTWSLTTQSTKFMGRSFPKLVKHENYLIMAGGNHNNNSISDLWASTDGIHWIQWIGGHTHLSHESQRYSKNIKTSDQANIEASTPNKCGPPPMYRKKKCVKRFGQNNVISKGVTYQEFCRINKGQCKPSTSNLGYQVFCKVKNREECDKNDLWVTKDPNYAFAENTSYRTKRSVTIKTNLGWETQYCVEY